MRSFIDSNNMYVPTYGTPCSTSSHESREHFTGELWADKLHFNAEALLSAIWSRSIWILLGPNVSIEDHFKVKDISSLDYTSV